MIQVVESFFFHSFSFHSNDQFELKIYGDLVVSRNSEVNFIENILNQLKANCFNFLKDCNGIFFLLVTNKKDNSILLIQNHLGVFPIYFAVTNNKLILSDYDLFVAKELNLNFTSFSKDYLLNNLLSFNYTKTIHPQIKTVKYGTIVKLRNNKISIQVYWNPSKIKSKKSDVITILNEAENLIQNTVIERVKNIESTASHVSGGLDSSVITAVLQNYPKKSTFFAYSWSPTIEDQTLKNDERINILKLTDFLSLEPIFVDYKRANEISYSKKIDPRFDIYYESYLLQHAKQNGIKTIFSGVGGDEFISSPFHGLKIDMFLNGKWKQVFSKNKSFLKNIKVFVKEIISPYLGISFEFYKRKKIKKNTFYLKSKNRLKNYLIDYDNFYYKSRKDKHIRAIKYGHLKSNYEMYNYIGHQFGVKYEFPFLDKRLVEFVLQLDNLDLVNFKQNRPLIRRFAQKVLPTEVANQYHKVAPSIDDFIKKEAIEWTKKLLLENLFEKSIIFNQLFEIKNIKNDAALFLTNNLEKNKLPAFIDSIQTMNYIYIFKNYYENELNFHK